MTFSPGFVRYLCRMAETLALAPGAPREERYEALSNRWKALMGSEPNRMANLANAAAVLKEAFDWHWVGFYLVDAKRDELVLGPFQGPLACTRLYHGKGVCAAAWDEATVQVVPDVHAFEGHVACSSLTESELVIPIVVAEKVVAVLDIDSTKPADVSSADVTGLAPLVALLAENWNAWE
jgi:GAF domain-containing protein